MPRVCKICRSNSSRLVCVPRDIKKRQMWINATGIILEADNRICESHFNESEFVYRGKRKVLQRNAVPQKIGELHPEERHSDVKDNSSEFSSQTDLQKNPYVANRCKANDNGSVDFKEKDIPGGSQFQTGHPLNYKHEHEKLKVRDNNKSVVELIEEAEEREAAVPFVSAPSENDPLAEEQSKADNTLPNEVKCRTCSRLFVVDDNARDLSDVENAVMLYHIEFITGIWIQCNDEVSHFMCSQCVDNLSTAIQFRETCIRTELLFTGGDDVDPPENGIELCEIDKVEWQMTDDIKVEEFVEEATVSKETSVADSSSLALGVQIYKGLLSEYQAKDDAPQTKEREATIPETQSKNKSKQKPRESGVKRTKQTKEERNRIRREHRKALPRNHVCDQCGASFRVKCNLTIHMLRHTRTKNYQCPECPNKFYDAYTRNMHIRVRHRGEKPFVCKYCPKAFKDGNIRYFHEKNDHGATPRIQSNLNKLNQRIVLKESQTQPESIVDEDGRYCCSHCDKSYVSKYALNMHVNQHLGLTPYKCKLCDKRFANSIAKHRHEMKHDSKRPFECDICLKGFYTRVNLKYHERIHTGERPYRCDICDTFFRYKFNLKSHQYSKMHKDNLLKTQNEMIVEESSLSSE